MTTLARLVARVREEATDRLHQTLFDLLTPAQRMILELTVEAEAGARYSDPERWRKGPAVPSCVCGGHRAGGSSTRFAAVTKGSEVTAGSTEPCVAPPVTAAVGSGDRERRAEPACRVGQMVANASPAPTATITTRTTRTVSVASGLLRWGRCTAAGLRNSGAGADDDGTGCRLGVARCGGAAGRARPAAGRVGAIGAGAAGDVGRVGGRADGGAVVGGAAGGEAGGAAGGGASGGAAR